MNRLHGVIEENVALLTLLKIFDCGRVVLTMRGH